MPSGGAPYAAPTHDVELTDESFSVADIFRATMLGNASRNELLTEDGPLRDYVDRARARPACQRAEARDR